jgi:ribosome-binding factor A
MSQGSRPQRVGEEIRQELSQMLAREIHDPGIGFVTLTHVKVSPDLQVARVYYTTIGDERSRRETRKALDRATPFLRRQLASRIRLRRVPELHFQFDESVEKQDRIERILIDLQKERETHGSTGSSGSSGSTGPEPGESGEPEEPEEPAGGRGRRT